MSLDQTHCPFSSLDDHKAAIYHGHLLARAEQMSGLSDRTDNLALMWLATVAWADKSRLWKLSLSGLRENDIDHGDWNITVRSDLTDPDPVGIHRREFLAEEGRQVLALASPFLPVEGESLQEKLLQTGRRNLAEASAMRLILSSPEASKTYEISDLHGNRATVHVAKKNLISRISSNIYQCLSNTYKKVSG